jgi:hypothetical protein
VIILAAAIGETPTFLAQEATGSTMNITCLEIGECKGTIKQIIIFFCLKMKHNHTYWEYIPVSCFGMEYTNDDKKETCIYHFCLFEMELYQYGADNYSFKYSKRHSSHENSQEYTPLSMPILQP